MIRVAAYCRVSTEGEDQANSFESQKSFFMSYIARNAEWELFAIYADEGISGTSTRNRLQFNQMIQDAQDGCFQLILTKEISRFSRNILDTISYTRSLKTQGVGVLFLTENINSLLPESEMLLSIMGTLAQEESRRTSVRVKWGQTRQMEKGTVFGPSLLGYRVNNGALIIQREEAELVRSIFQKYGIERKGMSEIARELQEAGLRTARGNTEWTPRQIARILKNEKYAGDLVQKKSITPDYLSHRKKKNQGEEPLIRITDHHEPIVSRKLWDLVQGRLKECGAKAECGKQASTHPFSGRIRCGECGRNFVCRYKYLSDGRRIRRWCCGGAVSAGKRKCEMHRLLRDETAGEMLKTAFCKLSLDREAVIFDILIALKSTTIQEELRKLKKALERTQNQKRIMLEAFYSGDITKEEMAAAKRIFAAKMEQLTQQIAQLEKGMEESEQMPLFLERILTELPENVELLTCILEEIRIYMNGNIELRFSALSQVFLFRATNN